MPLFPHGFPLFCLMKRRLPMKFLHTADLHIGKKIFEISLIEDQKRMLEQIFDIACKERVDAVVIAGDVYDRAVPATDAVALLDDFLTKLAAAEIPVIVISGNHDSPQRVGFADRILEKQGIYIAANDRGEAKLVTLRDTHGPVTFVCIPFVKPGVVGGATSAQAVERILSEIPFTQEAGARRILVTHYFVIGEHGETPELSQSESDINVGGLDGIPVSLLQGFDYVALGHIHKPQRIGDGNVYYSGSGMKYSFSEGPGEKSVNVVELGAEGEVKVERRPLLPLHEMRCIRGRLEQLISREAVEAQEAGREDYIQATLTDREELIDPMAALRGVYPNVLQILPEKNQDNQNMVYESRIKNVKKSTAELFSGFYEMLKGEPLDEKRRAIVEEAASQAMEGERNVSPL